MLVTQNDENSFSEFVSGGFLSTKTLFGGVFHYSFYRNHILHMSQKSAGLNVCEYHAAKGGGDKKRCESNG